MLTRHRRLREHLVDAVLAFGLGAFGATVAFALTAWWILDWTPTWP